MKTAECVSPKHPDKICDLIADTLLDTYLKEDKNSRCAIEVMGGHNLIMLNGEVTSKSKVDVKKIVKKLVGPNFKIITNLQEQSIKIGEAVDSGGAGDQGIMIGYACSENDEMVPQEYYLARDLCNFVYKQFPYDGKTQITLNYKNEVEKVVISFQNTNIQDLMYCLNSWTKQNKISFSKTNSFFLNPAGYWNQGGFDADTGLSGRKIVIDNYGPEIPIGGGSFSGKDYTKVDRSGAYMARKIAVDYLKKYNAKEIYTKLAYAIGKTEPVMAVVTVDGKEMKIKDYDLSPHGIYKHLKLNKVKFSQTSNWGHFGRGFSWD
ncbi:MAG: methionine adenosyltransferase domain-containing protein [Patescibacteria group bacterium]|nr:methionine adenosyltransferase domain-containing protein [Patescibacteria group bacterium]